MDISNFELIFLPWVYVGILWLTLSSLPEKPFLSIRQHSLENFCRQSQIAMPSPIEPKFLMMMCQILTVSSLPQACPPARESEAVSLETL